MNISLLEDNKSVHAIIAEHKLGGGIFFHNNLLWINIPQGSL